MGGGGVPGPQTGNQDEEARGGVGQSGTDVPGPIAANEGDQQNITLSGWPRAISWSEFPEVDARPAGQSEDAQIATETITGEARTRRSGGQWMLAELDLEITVNRESSWVVTSRKSTDLLSHEQGHFDIQGIIIGRDVVAALAAVRARSNRNLAAALRRIMARARRRGEQMTNTYDTDTRHGLDADRQAAWDRQIRNAIDHNTPLRAPE